MPQTAAEDVFNAITALSVDLLGPNVVVTEGPPLDYTVGVTHLMLGVDDPDENGPTAVTFDQEWASTISGGWSRDESGELRFAAAYIDGNGGDAGIQNARVAVFDVANAVVAAIKSNLDLDVATLLWTSPLKNCRLKQDQVANGAYALLSFGVQYRARIQGA